MRKLLLLFFCLITMVYFCGKKQEEPKAIEQKTGPNTIEKLILKDTIKPVPQHEKSEEQKQIEQEQIATAKIKTNRETKKSAKEISTTQLWQKYKKSRESSKEAFNNSEFQQAIDNLITTANYAEKLDRNDLAAWQYNNIGYYSILEFKGKTNYDYRLHQLRSIKDKEETNTYRTETKKIFNDNIKILTDAEKHLKKALEIDANYTEKNRTEKINNNIKFIEWVKNFLKN